MCRSSVNANIYEISGVLIMAILALFFYLLTLSINSVSADFFNEFCDGGGNYTAKSPFESNLNLLLSSLSSTNATFFNDTKGSAPDQAYGLVLCGGDVTPTDCAACLKTAATDVLSRCPLSKQATVWYDNCQLRYSDVSFFSTFDSLNDNVRSWWNVRNATDVGPFVEMDTRLLDAVSNAAASVNSSTMFATGMATNLSVDSSNGQQTVYAKMQCTRDLSADDCGRCLQQIRGNSNWVWARRGGRVYSRSCYFRYETYPFFHGKPTVSLDLLPSPPPPPPPPPAPLTPSPPAANDEKGKSCMLL